jgi:hypothetical protein
MSDDLKQILKESKGPVLKNWRGGKTNRRYANSTVEK